jgi:GNAT superfamily N-acetyltransferase
MSDDAVKIFHLEMRERQALVPKQHSTDFNIAPVVPADPSLNQQLYRDVGSSWQWTDRLSWDEPQWSDYVARKCLTTWIGYWKGKRAGYFELESQNDGNVEIMYFGLLPEFIGMGLGGILLTAAVECAWREPHTTRVWVHTCSNDHKLALANYLKRGFQLFKTEFG